jgi:copper chaperone CopZ
MANWKTINLRVNGEQKIHCASCENSIQRALTMLPGVKSVKADHHAQQIDVSLDSEQINLDQLKQKLDFMGYVVVEE